MGQAFLVAASFDSSLWLLQNETLNRQIQKEIWRIQDVMEGLRKNNPSRGTDTAKHRGGCGSAGLLGFLLHQECSGISVLQPIPAISPCRPEPFGTFSGPQVGVGFSFPLPTSIDHVGHLETLLALGKPQEPLHLPTPELVDDWWSLPSCWLLEPRGHQLAFANPWRAAAASPFTSLSA